MLREEKRSVIRLRRCFNGETQHGEAKKKPADANRFITTGKKKVILINESS